MSFFLVLILGFIIYFVLWPILKVWLAVRSARQRAKQFFNEANRQQQQTQYQNQNAWPRRKRKKIDPSVGEYVNFEEVNTFNASEQPPVSVKYEVEEQVVDVEWEDIK